LTSPGHKISGQDYPEILAKLAQDGVVDLMFRGYPKAFPVPEATLERRRHLSTKLLENPSSRGFGPAHRLV